MTHREIVLQAIWAQLSAANIGASIFRTRVESFNRDELPAVVIMPASEGVQQFANGLSHRRFVVHFDLHGRAPDPNTPAESALDGVVQKLHVALMQDVTLGGQVARVEEQGSEFEFADGDETALRIKITYQFIYLTRNADLVKV